MKFNLNWDKELVNNHGLCALYFVRIELGENIKGDATPPCIRHCTCYAHIAHIMSKIQGEETKC